jgi:hypothetical protein
LPSKSSRCFISLRASSRKARQRLTSPRDADACISARLFHTSHCVCKALFSDCNRESSASAGSGDPASEFSTEAAEVGESAGRSSGNRRRTLGRRCGRRCRGTRSGFTLTVGAGLSDLSGEEYDVDIAPLEKGARQDGQGCMGTLRSEVFTTRVRHSLQKRWPRLNC